MKIFVLLVLFASSVSLAQETDDTTPTLEIGAKVFWQRCVLCHGDQGMGEGAIPLKLKEYPNTNLISSHKAKTQAEIHEVITMGGMLDNISQYMPPMGNELTWTEVESVSMFIFNLRKDPETYLALLKQQSEHQVADKRLGSKVYKSRCILCHGDNGEGDGRMAKVIKSPPPFNLTKSVMPAAYLKMIITKGGAELGRSVQMPPWGDQLSEKEIDSVVEYISSIRR